jgi:hypothetical protein
MPEDHLPVRTAIYLVPDDRVNLGSWLNREGKNNPPSNQEFARECGPYNSYIWSPI